MGGLNEVPINQNLDYDSSNEQLAVSKALPKLPHILRWFLPTFNLLRLFFNYVCEY